MKNYVLTLVLILWAILFYCVGANADILSESTFSPAYAFMPQNIHHNTIFTNNSQTFDVSNCKTLGTVYKIVVEKSKKTMTLYDVNDCVVKTYKVRTGLNKGAKQCKGDKKTPEGTYKIKDKRNSKYVKFLELDYPRQKDINKAKQLGCNAGNAIGIHYYNKEYTNDPSTLEGSLGCITVWNKEEIKEINNLVRIGTIVEIKE